MHFLTALSTVNSDVVVCLVATFLAPLESTLHAGRDN